MSIRNPRARLTLPAIVDPEHRLCFTVPVPNERYHLAAFRGAILNLASALNWQDDPDHTAREVALVWREIYDLIVLCKPADITIESWDEDLTSLCESLRWHNGVLQGLCCGDWVNIPGGGPSTNVQPTDGGTPVAGSTTCYKAVLQANGKWLLPVQVSEGDIITVNGAVGGWSDGTISWYCPNGGFYTLGACGTGSAPSGSDPVPTISHMRLIAEVDTTFYDAIDNAIAVPAGLTDVNVTFQANDASLSDNFGSIAFDVCVKKQSIDDTITLTYALGTGPTTARRGDTLILTSTCCGGGGGADYGVNVTFSSPVKVHVVGNTGFTIACPGGGSCVYAFGQQPVGTTVTSLSTPANPDPRSFDDTVDISLFDLECGTCGASWSVTVTIE